MATKKNPHFFSHSLNLILSRLSLAVSGILFWWLAAKIYSVEEIGLGSVFISISSFFIFLSSLGIAPTFVRFLPENNDKSRLIGTFLIFSLLFLISLCTIFLIGINFFLPKLSILKTSFYPLFFVLFVISMHLFQTLDGVYISFTETFLVLVKHLIQNFLRLFLLFLFTFLGGFGIFTSNCISALIAVFISLIYFLKKLAFSKIWLIFKVDHNVLKKLLPFSLANFLNSLSLQLPGMIFPLIILSLYSKRDVGLFYIPWMMFSVYCTLINSINNIFLMKASYGEEITTLLKKATIFILILGIIGFLGFTLWGDKILLIFKKDFSQNSFGILKLLFSSIFFYIINQIYITILNIKKDVKNIGIIAILIILNIIIFAILFMPKRGSEGIALAWLFANFIGSIYILISLLIKNKRKNKWDWSLG